MNNIFICTGISFSLLFLSACSSTDHSVKSSNESEGLTSLLAAAIFVREHCPVVKVPSDTALINTLITMSRSSGSPLTEESKPTLSAKAGVRYVALMRDEAPLEKKCASLVPLTNAFIQQSLLDHADK